MKRILVFILIVFVAETAYCGKPKSDAVYHLIRREYKMNSDGSTDIRYRKELQLFSHNAFFHVYGETFIPYNTEYQTLTINEAYTVRKDGSRVETPKNAFNPSLPSGCTDCERYNTIREMVVTHTALEYGATIVLDYTIHTELAFMSDVLDRINLYEEAPIERYEIVVTLPVGMTLQSFVNYYGKKIEPSHVLQDSNQVLRWDFENLPQRPADAYLPKDYLPYILITTMAGPSDFMENLTFQNAFLPQDLHFCQAKVTELTDGLESEVDKMLAIRNFVADHIHTNDVSLKLMNFIVTSPFMVWHTNCGSRIDKDMLLTTMLRAAGLRADFGLLYGSLMQESASAVKVVADGKPYYITSARKSPRCLSLDLPGDSFLSQHGDVESFSAQASSVDVVATVDVRKEGAEVKADVTLQRGQVSGSSALSTMRPAPPVSVKATVKGLADGYYRVYPVANPVSHPQSFRISKDRTLPVEIPLTEEHYSYTITLPAGARCLSKPYSLSRTADFGSMHLTMTCEGNIVTVTRTLSFTKPFVSDKKQIARLREMLVEWDTERPVIFQCK